jgi:prepilin-type N-terminal cleavage/methylation domain-containing protein
MTTRKGFTLIELMVVILIVGILAAAAIPLMRGRIDSAKWAEANATAGTIKSAVRVYFAEKGLTAARACVGAMNVPATQTALGFTQNDLEGTYFAAGDYKIVSVDANGTAVITVKNSKANAPVGTRTLAIDGSWQ